MKNHVFGLLLTCVCVAASTACKNSPSPTSSTPTSVTLTIPDPVSPAANATVKNVDQPLTLTIKNVTVTGSGTVTYTFEVATDSAFNNKVVTKSGVAEGSGGQTSTTIDRLTAGADYFWRARGEAGGTIGAVSSANKFSIGPAVTVDAPVPLSPADGSTVSRRPTLRVRNAVKSSSAGAITYKFEISTSSSFSTITTSSTQSETTTDTSFTPASALAGTTTYFWRVTATDATNGVSSSASTTQGFTTTGPSLAESIATQQGLTLWTGAVPSGTPGQTSMSRGWDIDNLVSYDGQPYLNPPIEALRLYDLMDRGMEPDDAIDWLTNNSYPSTGQYYAGPDVIGIPHVYLARIGGAWELVHRAGG